MAEPNQGTLLRSRQGIEDVAQPGLALLVEHDLGIGSLRIVGPEADQTFQHITGHEPPEVGRLETRDEVSFAWLAPGEWLVIGKSRCVDRVIARLTEQGGDSVLAVDLRHGRTAMLLSGEDVRTAIAAHCPLDLSDANFPISAAARSLLGDAVMFLARLPDTPHGTQFRIIIDQTLALYGARLLVAANVS